MQVVLLLLAVVLFPFRLIADALEESFSVSYDYYSDNVDVQVYSPAFDFRKRLSEYWGMGVSLRLDAISAASIRNGSGRYEDSVVIDAVSGASDRLGFDDFRAAPTLSFVYEKGDFVGSFGAYYSNEIDYNVYSGFMDLTYAFNDANTVLSVGGVYSYEVWTPSTNRYLPTDDKTLYSFSASITQLINPKAYVQLRAEYVDQSGLLSSPYHYLLQDGFAQYDRYPDRRRSFPIAFQYVQQLGDITALNADYRFYSDTWEMTSHTGEVKLMVDLGENITVGVRERLYGQSEVGFIKPLKDVSIDDRYIVSNYKYSALFSSTTGASILWRPSYFEDENVVINLSANYYTTDENAYILAWYGTTKIQAFYTTFGFNYEY